MFTIRFTYTQYNQRVESILELYCNCYHFVVILNHDPGRQDDSLALLYHALDAERAYAWPKTKESVVGNNHLPQSGTKAAFLSWQTLRWLDLGEKDWCGNIVGCSEDLYENS